MRFARPELALLLAAAPALAARAPAPPPPIELPAAAPMIDAEIAGQAVRLMVDAGGDAVVQINPGSPARPLLAAAARADGQPAPRGIYRVSVGQTTLTIPFSRETMIIAGRTGEARVMTPDVAPPGQPPGSDGTIGLPLLPHAAVTLRWRPEGPGDGRISLPLRSGRSETPGFDWQLAVGGKLDVELHPLRADTVASAAAASRLAAAGGGTLTGPVRRLVIAYGTPRPVRRLQLARPVTIAGLTIAGAEVRLFDWAGRSDLPPDANPDDMLTAVGKRGRQRGWPVLKLGQDVLNRCASISWQRQPDLVILRCPTG